MNSDNTETKNPKYTDAHKKAYKKYLEKNKENINKKQREKNKLKKNTLEYKDKIKKYTESHKEKLKNGTVKKRAINPSLEFINAEKQNLKFMNKILSNITKQKNALETSQQNNPLINNKEKINENENIISMLLLNMKDNFKNDIKQLENRTETLEYKTYQPLDYTPTPKQKKLINDLSNINETVKINSPFENRIYNPLNNTSGFLPIDETNSSNFLTTLNINDIPTSNDYSAFNDVESDEERKADIPQQPIFYEE